MKKAAWQAVSIFSTFLPQENSPHAGVHIACWAQRYLEGKAGGTGEGEHLFLGR